MEDASAITSLPDDPQALKQIILNLSCERDENARQRDERTRERDDWHVKFLRVETELLRLPVQRSIRSPRRKTRQDLSPHICRAASDG